MRPSPLRSDLACSTNFFALSNPSSKSAFTRSRFVVASWGNSLTPYHPGANQPQPANPTGAFAPIEGDGMRAALPRPGGEGAVGLKPTTLGAVPIAANFPAPQAR
jgi:hypothetical protein